MRILIIIIGKIMAALSRLFNIGAGGTWPGEIALTLDKDFIKKMSQGVKKGIILVAGTNGKTTTSKIIQKILENEGRSNQVIHNHSGANLLNGIASAMIKSADFFGQIKVDWAVFEVDENTLPLVLGEFTPQIVVCLNLFRDQLDRYGEIDLIAEKWRRALKKLPSQTKVILNSDDPQIAFLGKDLEAEVLYFGLESQEDSKVKISHAADSIHCLFCGTRLDFKRVYFSHLGLWQCKKCGEKRPKPSLSDWNWFLPGIYNRYNILAAVSAVKSLSIKDENIQIALKSFEPVFGRGEEFSFKDKKVKILLSKNPTGFNVTLQRIIKQKPKIVLLALNDRIPDGRDVSWIWDVDFEELVQKVDHLIISGDRAYDLGLRIKYALKALEHKNMKTLEHNSKFKIFQELEKAIFVGLDGIKVDETLYILPTYSAMLEIRKILRGRKIL